MRIQDALGRDLEIPSPPRRIVSLVPSLTELLADLGLDEQVVGLTSFCVRPPGWRASKTRVGGTKDVRTERLLALEPDLVLANKEENTKQAVETLEGRVPVYVTDISTIEDSLAAIQTLGTVVDRPAEAEALAAEIEAAFAALPPFTPLRAAYLIWRSPYMCAGGATFIHDVMDRAGFVNVFADRERYPEATPEQLRDTAPDVVLLSSEPFPFTEKHLAEVEADGGARPVLINGELFSWYGSRLRHTPAYLRELRARLAALGDRGTTATPGSPTPQVA